MIKTLFNSILIYALGAVLAPTLLAEPAAERVAGNAEKGKQPYYDHGCYACHGYRGIGKHNIANDVSGIMMNESVFLIFLRARSELNPPLPFQGMPHYPESSLPDAEALDIYAYIKTFSDDPPSADSNATLQEIIRSAESQLQSP